MDFFQRIAALNLTGDLKLVITGTPERQRVTLLLVNDKCGDEARKLITPFNLTGTPSELDAGFFEQIEKPMQQASGLMVNLETFQKSLEKTQQESAQVKQAEQAQQKAKDERKKSYDTAMKKVDELEKEKKYREAYAKIPDPEQFPDQADVIRKKRTELRAQFTQPGLFDSVEVPTTSQPVTEASAVIHSVDGVKVPGVNTVAPATHESLTTA